MFGCVLLSFGSCTEPAYAQLRSVPPNDEAPHYIPLSSVSLENVPFSFEGGNNLIVADDSLRIICELENTGSTAINGLQVWALVYFPNKQKPLRYEHSVSIYLPPDSSQTLMWVEPYSGTLPVTGTIVPYYVEFAGHHFWSLNDYYLQNGKTSSSPEPPVVALNGPNTGSIISMADRNVYTTAHNGFEPPEIDGILNDELWRDADWVGSFTQREPYDGTNPTQNTSFKIRYDSDNIYVAVRAHDSEPNRIEKRGTRRDVEDGDRIEVSFDSYNDKRTSFSFIVSAAGVRSDKIISQDGWRRETSWNPVWEARVSSDNTGWYTEMRIPFNQLRYSDNPDKVWGLQVGRVLYRNSEKSYWQHIPKNETGWVSRFGELRGIINTVSKRRIEFLPYMSSKISTSLEEAGNPFATGSSQSSIGGLDAKIGITNNLTFDLTVNPDFGQVEADLAVINLSAFETFFPEKRPFFIEGKDITNFQLGTSGHERENLFFSRRIGRKPSHSPDTEDDTYSDVPTETSIASAIKLTGKTQSGLSVGFLSALTQKENAELIENDVSSTIAVEPLSHYFVGRLNQDFRSGSTQVGGMLTAVNRDVGDDHLTFLNTSAYTGGLDFFHQWNDKTYMAEFKSLFSHIRGNQEAILDAQTASGRYFQRPDATHVSVDSSATSMSGYGGAYEIGKIGGHFRYNMSGKFRSPGLELNDIGFLTESDRINHNVSLQYTEWNPAWFYRSYNVRLEGSGEWNFEKSVVARKIATTLRMQFTNFWRTRYTFSYDEGAITTNWLQGGPTLHTGTHTIHSFGLNSDSRKALSVNFNTRYDFRSDDLFITTSFNPSITYRPSDALKLTVTPSYAKTRNEQQYIDTYETDNGPQFILGTIHQKTLSTVLRLDYGITPNLTIEYFSQPFIASGNYTKFKRVVQSTSHLYEERLHDFVLGDDIFYDAEDDEYCINNGEFNFSNPDFSSLQFRSNLVVRWEYKPGSTLFLVWSQNRSGSAMNGHFGFQDDFTSLYNLHPDNVFLMKANHWFSW